MLTRLEEVGRGSFGVVYKARDNHTKRLLAVKVIDLESTEDEIEDIQQEIAVLSQCHSPNVVAYYGSHLKVTYSESHHDFINTVVLFSQTSQRKKWT